MTAAKPYAFWTAVLEVRGRHDLEHVVDSLLDYDVAVFAGVDGTLEVTVTVPAVTLRQALLTALAVVEAAADGEVRSMDIAPAVVAVRGGLHSAAAGAGRELEG